WCRGCAPAACRPTTCCCDCRNSRPRWASPPAIPSGRARGCPIRSARTRSWSSSAWCACCSPCGRWPRRARPSWTRRRGRDSESREWERNSTMAEIPQAYRDLFDKKSFAHVATVGADGAPQVTPVWIDQEGQYIRFNTARGRVKTQNLERMPKIALSVQDPENPYRYIQVRGRVVEVTEKGADAHIDALAKKYLGQDRYPYRQPGEVRVTVKVMPEK